MIKYERPVSLAARWARISARLAFFLLVVALLSHRFGSLTTPHLLALALLSALLAMVGVLLAVVGFVRLWQVAAVGGVASFTALAYAVLPLAVAGLALAAYVTRPAIYDLSTDTASPPPWIVPPKADQGWLPQRVAVTPQDRAAQVAAYPGVTGRRYDGALDRVFQGVKKVALETGIVIIAKEGEENAEPDLEDLALKSDAGAGGDSRPETVPIPLTRPEPPGILPEGRRSTDILLQGEWRTLIVGLGFDVLIRLREEAETTFVDLRVAAGTGPHDLGLGARFADRFLHALDAELLGIAGD